ncbi:MAG: RluA family pseudouridine synthase [Candidatus Omnitrophica bacterium]|nr:RluA family pseudouridine synthase [Candidatus Omnitrophota bacterium]MDD5671094.1 RluA family pseudouridine synthase [Candidatus Omnitrophota bacterium]
MNENLTAQSRCPVLYRDQWLLIVNKPAGILSHPNPVRSGKGAPPKGKPAAAAFQGNYHFEDRRFDTPAGPVWLIHRLDQDVSGVLLATLDRETAQSCRALFEKHEIQKRYLALVAGRPVPASGKWRDHLAERRQASFVRGFVRSSAHANAELRYRTLKFFQREQLALLEIELITGKTHQIRVQSAFHRHPVIGDGVYGNFMLNRKLRKDLGLRHIFLHAAQLGLKHPKTGQFLMIEAPLPEELQSGLDRAY